MIKDIKWLAEAYPTKRERRRSISLTLPLQKLKLKPLHAERGGICVTIISPRIKIKDANRSSFAPTNRKGSNGRLRLVRVSLGPVSPAQLERHYGCCMLACRIPLKRLMPGSLSQPRTRYPPAACSDLVNEFISSVATAGSAPPPPPHSESFCRASRQRWQLHGCVCMHVRFVLFFKNS